MGKLGQMEVSYGSQTSSEEASEGRPRTPKASDEAADPQQKIPMVAIPPTPALFLFFTPTQSPFCTLPLLGIPKLAVYTLKARRGFRSTISEIV